MRTVVLADGSGGSGGLDPLWFPGGHKMKREGNPALGQDAAHVAGST